MELNEVVFERIHHYLAEQMPYPERLRFEIEMEATPDLLEAVDIQRQIKASYPLLADKTTLNSIHNELKQAGLLWQPEPYLIRPAIRKVEPNPDQETEYTVGWTYYAIAASIVLTLGIGWYFFVKEDTKPTNDPVAQQHPKANKPVSSSQLEPAINTKTENNGPISTASPTQTSVSPEAREYETLADAYFDPSVRRKSITPDEPLTASHPSQDQWQRLPQDTTNVLTGIKLFNKGETAQAITALQSATSCILPDWQANARWFLALAYLKTNQPVKARKELQALQTGTTGLYKNEAETLLKSIK